VYQLNCNVKEWHMQSRLDGRTFIVAGATRGIGEAIVRGIVMCGGNVVFGGRDTASGEAIANDLGSVAKFVRLDAANEDDWRTIVQVAVSTFGVVHGLVNCAGIHHRSPLDELDMTEVRDLIGINQISYLIGIKHVVPLLRAAGTGSIVNIGSIGATRGYSELAAYCGTKGAIGAITRAAALELAPEGIRVNAVDPGPIATKMLDDAIGPNALEIVGAGTPMGRAGRPDEIAGPVIFLLSDNSSYITGASLGVDGGQAL
jgi:3alpha(or 20beta)-hydroxysteroid dehydrogenase